MEAKRAIYRPFVFQKCIPEGNSNSVLFALFFELCILKIAKQLLKRCIQWIIILRR